MDSNLSVIQMDKLCTLCKNANCKTFALYLIDQGNLRIKLVCFTISLILGMLK